MTTERLTPAHALCPAQGTVLVSLEDKALRGLTAAARREPPGLFRWDHEALDTELSMDLVALADCPREADPRRSLFGPADRRVKGPETIFPDLLFPAQLSLLRSAKADAALLPRRKGEPRELTVAPFEAGEETIARRERPHWAKLFAFLTPSERDERGE